LEVFKILGVGLPATIEQFERIMRLLRDAGMDPVEAARAILRMMAPKSLS
jgi:hypothetical protein